MKAPDHMVYIVDDDPFLVESLSDLLSSAGFNTTSYRSAHDYLAGERPKVPGCLVLDIGLPDVDGMEFHRTLGNHDHPPVVFLTGQATISSSVRAMKQGAVDYLTKPCRHEDFLGAVRAALQQHRDRRQSDCEKAELQARYLSLTNRERQVLSLVVSGYLNKQAAALLSISEVTYQIHRGRVMQKMMAKSLADLVRMSEKLSLPLDEPASRIGH